MDAFHVIAGSQSGYLKGVSLNDANFTNIYTPSEKGREVIGMCWNDETEQDVCVGTIDQEIKVFDNSGFFVSHNLSGGDGEKLVGLCKVNENLLTCTNGGLVRLWTQDLSGGQESKKVGPDVCLMKHNKESPNLIATGGRENDLKIWDINSSFSEVFSAKNVKNDWLNLRVPVWVLDAAFLSGSEKIIASTSHHQVRMYDPKCQRRPVLDMLFEESPITTISLARNEMQLIVGNSLGGMGLLDLRGKSGKLVHKFKGPTGALKSVQYIPSSDLFACCSLDRFVRIYNITNKSLEHKVFLKAKLNCLLLRQGLGELYSKPKAASIDSETKKDSSRNKEDSEIWSQMDVVRDGEEQGVPKKSLKNKTGKDIIEKKSRKRKRCE